MTIVDVVIPALNEADNIAQVVRGLLAQDVRTVIVVDNGSTDDTASRAQGAGAVVVDEPRIGYGQACKSGADRAVADGADIIVWIDGDQSSRAAELGLLIDPIVNGTADLVLGSRVLGTIQPGAMGPHQRFGNWLASRLMASLYRIEVTDLGPYRAIRSEVYAQLEMSEMTFGWPTEMMTKCAGQGFEITEVPVSWDRRASGRSKVSGTIRGSVLAARHILGVTLRQRFRPSPSASRPHRN